MSSSSSLLHNQQQQEPADSPIPVSLATASPESSPRVVARLRLTTSRNGPPTAGDWDFFPPASPVFVPPPKRRLLPPTPPKSVFPQGTSSPYHLPLPRRSRTPGPVKPNRTPVTRSKSLTAPKSSARKPDATSRPNREERSSVAAREDATPREVKKSSGQDSPTRLPVAKNTSVRNRGLVAANPGSGPAKNRPTVAAKSPAEPAAKSHLPRPRRSLPVINSNGAVPVAPKSVMPSAEETTRLERLPTKIPVPNKAGDGPKPRTQSSGASQDIGKKKEPESATRRPSGPSAPVPASSAPAEGKEEEEGRKRRSDASGNTGASSRVTKTAATAQHPHLFYIGGSNGAQLVEAPLLAMGWKRTMDKHCENFKLRWTETKGQVNYNTFKEGDQLVNHIPNCDLITNKLGLLLSLREYERVTWAVKNRPPRLQMCEFVPETYIVDDRREREAFFEAHKDGDIWICKPTGWNQGKGIYLVRDIEQYKQELTSREAKMNDKNVLRRPMGRVVQKKSGRMIIQRYLKNPLLLDERKFDIRAYMIIASTMPFLVLYQPGYVRLCMHKYSNSSTDMTIHLTNQFIQKKDPGYEDVKNDTIWSMDKLYEYILETYGEEKKLNENIGKILDRQMQRIMLHVFNAVRHKLAARVGFFEIYGFDFMIDTDMNVWLIEVNINPAMHVNCDLLREVLPPIIEETLHVSIECFEKAKRHQPLLPLSSLKSFQILFSTSNAVRNVRGSPQGNIKYNVTSRYRSQSQSPARDSQTQQQIHQQLQNSPYAQSLTGQSGADGDLGPRRMRQPPALAYSTRAPNYDPNAGKAGPPVPSTASLPTDDKRAKPFEDSLRRYKRIDNRRVSRPSLTGAPPAAPAPAPVQWNRSVDANPSGGEEGEEGEAAPTSGSYETLANANSALAAALTRVAHDRTLENRRNLGGGSNGELPTLGSLRMRTPRQTPRETSTTRFMPAPMTTVRVISTTNSPTPGELAGAAPLPLAHPLNQHRLKPTLHALSNPPHKRARSPPDRSS